MHDTNEDASEQQRLEHSLPGTDQAGNGPTVTETTEDVVGSRRDQSQDEIKTHSLPGTNQAGKGGRPKGD